MTTTSEAIISHKLNGTEVRSITKIEGDLSALLMDTIILGPVVVSTYAVNEGGKKVFAPVVVGSIVKSEEVQLHEVRSSLIQICRYQ
jgi:hypothetical protein